MNYKSGILSLLLTGLGQIRNGSLLKGLVFMFGPLAAILVAQLGLFDTLIGVIVFLAVFLLWKIACIVDALRNEAVESKWFNKPLLIGLLLVFWYTLPLTPLIKEFRKYSTYSAFNVPTTSMKSTLFIGDCFFSKSVSSSEVQRGDITVFIYPNQFSDEEISYVKRCVGLPGDHIQIFGGQVFINSIRERDSATYQSMYKLMTHSIISRKKFAELGIDEYALLNGEDIYEVYCTAAQASQLDSMEEVQAIRKVIDQGANPSVWPHSPDLGWNVDNYGPIVIPAKGQTVMLNDSTLKLYSSVISAEGGSVEADSYTYQKDYFFMLGDNRKRSADSRFWGFVPDENIQGRALYLYWSKNRDRIGLDLTQ